MHQDTRQSTRTRTRTARLDLRDVLLAQAELLVDAQHVLPDRQRRHAVRVVRDAAERLRALARRERLPPSLGTALAGVHCRSNQGKRRRHRSRITLLTSCPVHHVSRTLCQTTVSIDPRSRENRTKSSPSGPKNNISGLLYRSTRRSLIPGLCPGMSRSKIDCARDTCKSDRNPSIIRHFLE